MTSKITSTFVLDVLTDSRLNDFKALNYKYIKTKTTAFI